MAEGGIDEIRKEVKDAGIGLALDRLDEDEAVEDHDAIESNLEGSSSSLSNNSQDVLTQLVERWTTEHGTSEGSGRGRTSGKIRQMQAFLPNGLHLLVERALMDARRKKIPKVYQESPEEETQSDDRGVTAHALFANWQVTPTSSPKSQRRSQLTPKRNVFVAPVTSPIFDREFDRSTIKKRNVCLTPSPESCLKMHNSACAPLPTTLTSPAAVKPLLSGQDGIHVPVLPLSMENKEPTSSILPFHLEWSRTASPKPQLPLNPPTHFPVGVNFPNISACTKVIDSQEHFASSAEELVGIELPIQFKASTGDSINDTKGGATILGSRDKKDPPPFSDLNNCVDRTEARSHPQESSIGLKTKPIQMSQTDQGPTLNARPASTNLTHSILIGSGSQKSERKTKEAKRPRLSAVPDTVSTPLTAQLECKTPPPKIISSKNHSKKPSLTPRSKRHRKEEREKEKLERNELKKKLSLARPDLAVRNTTGDMGPSPSNQVGISGERKTTETSNCPRLAKVLILGSRLS